MRWIQSKWKRKLKNVGEMREHARLDEMAGFFYMYFSVRCFSKCVYIFLFFTFQYVHNFTFNSFISYDKFPIIYEMITSKMEFTLHIDSSKTKSWSFWPNKSVDLLYFLLSKSKQVAFAYHKPLSALPLRAAIAATTKLHHQLDYFSLPN